MTSILISSAPSHKQTERIPRIQERSFDISSLPGRGLSHTLTYKKPDVRPTPQLNPPVQAEELKCLDTEAVKLFRLREIMYHMSRDKLISICDDRADTFPPWTVFQSVIESDRLCESAEIVFNPIIMAPPNDFNTVYTTLKRTKEQMNALGQDVCPIVFDMGLLTKALEIVWARPMECADVIPIEGGMHYMMALFGGIGHVYGDAGLKDLLVDSDVFAKLTAEHILSGKDFDRALKAVIMVDEVLNRRFLQQFYLWVEKNSKPVPLELFHNLKALDINATHHGDLSNEITGLIESHIQPLIEMFRSEGRESSLLFRFWDDYLSEVSLPIKMYLASSRHGMWDVNQYAKTKLLPFLCASNRTIYSRFMPYQVLAMNRIPENLSDKFDKGLFVTKLTRGSFNAVWNDYVLEVTENKALKSSGGIIGITHNDKALARWFLSRPITAKYAITYNPNNVFDQGIFSNKHHTDTNFHIQSYNEGVKKMLDLFDDTFIDPFSVNNPPQKLVNFAPTDIELSLLSCHQTGRQMLHNFVSERLMFGESHTPHKNFFEPLSRTKVKTMSTTKSKVKATSKVVQINGEEMYLRLLAINAFKKVPIERVLSYENSPVPLSLFTDAGIMMATKKSDLLEKLENISGSPCSLKNVQNPDCF